MSEYEFAPSMTRVGVDAYVDLFSVSFQGNSKLSADYLDWLYVKNPHGGVQGFDAFSKGRLVAHYAQVPRRFRLGDTTYAGALSLNTATLPDHQGKGLFIKLATMTYEDAAERGVRFTIGAANANSVGGFVRKLRFRQLGNIRLYAGVDAPGERGEALDTDMDPAWVRWRLSNPSHRYLIRRKSDGRSVVTTRAQGIPFHLGQLASSLADAADDVDGIGRAMLPLPGLSPVFSANPPTRPALPFRMQPSPWHVIWRAHSPEVEPGLADRLRMDGLSMDTF